jgi:hypothetical protein
MNPFLEYEHGVTRRQFLANGQLSLGSIALATMLARDSSAKPGEKKKPGTHFKPRAKNVIYLHMAGSPSQLELFEHKPALVKYNGKKCPQKLLDGKQFAFIRGVPVMLGTPYKFRQHGKSGTWMSELLPNLSSVADEIAVIRSMSTDQFNHAPAQLLMHTGNPRLGAASMGSWVTYGLGSENEDLPGFVVLGSGGKTPSSGKSVWGSGFLPSVYQGVQCRTTGEPVFYASNPKGMSRQMRRQSLDAIRDLNRIQGKAFGDPETESRIAQYELAYRMQIAAPKIMDISKEPKHILEMYGAKPDSRGAEETATDPRLVANANNPTFANNCLLARRLVESGVRFVQLFDWGWDHHGSNKGEDINHNLPIKTRQIDRPIAALIKDLKQRGLLDDTLIVWGGEFGRTPMRENRGGRYGKYIGRDHHPHAFTMWMAGGGVKGGLNYGATDDLGYYITKNKMHPHDLQATILKLLGYDATKFSFLFQGLRQRLIGPTEAPRVHDGLIA